MMPNTNCLIDCKCPECGSEGPFTVAVNRWVSLDDDGTDEPPGGVGDTEYDETHGAMCQECDYSGKWGDFDVNSEGREFTVIGGCDNADGQFQPWIRHVKARSPRLAAIKGAKARAKEIDVDEDECLVMEVFQGHHCGYLGNWGPVDVKQLKVREHKN
jgi:hypothetical protein